MSPHLPIRVLPGECPLNASALGVAPLLPYIYFGGEYCEVGQTPVKTLAIKDTDFDFGHVEPAGVFRGVVEYHSPQ